MRIPQVEIIFTCTACRGRASIKRRWGAHHSLPRGWSSRDTVPTYALCRRTDHIFACSPACEEKLNDQYPPPPRPKWFPYA